MMRRNVPAQPQPNTTMIIIIGAVAVAVIVLALGFLLGMGLTRQSDKPTALPAGYAQTAIALTLAAQPTDTQTATPAYTDTPSPTPTPTYTPTPTPTATRVYVAWVPSATEYVTLPNGTRIPAEYAITPVATNFTVVCNCQVTSADCWDFRLPREAQMCYDSCRAQLCTDEDTYETCDPWGLDASDGSTNGEHWVCGFNDSAAPGGYPSKK